MALTEQETAELKTRKTQLAARTKPDGTALAGYRNNVAAVKARIAELERKAASN